MTKSVERNELCRLIANELAQWNSESIEEVACRILVEHVKYIGDDMFEIGNLDDMRLKPVETK